MSYNRYNYDNSLILNMETSQRLALLSGYESDEQNFELALLK